MLYRHCRQLVLSFEFVRDPRPIFSQNFGQFGHCFQTTCVSINRSVREHVFSIVKKWPQTEKFSFLFSIFSFLASFNEKMTFYLEKLRIRPINMTFGPFSAKICAVPQNRLFIFLRPFG